MKLTIKKLQGGECTVEVQPSTYISELKRQVAQQLKIPVDEQKLLFLGRTLADEQTIKSYPTIKEGSKLNLIVKKPESLSELVLKSFKKAGIADVEAKNATDKFLSNLKDNLNKLSWDDIDRLASNCLDEELKKPVPSPEEMVM